MTDKEIKAHIGYPLDVKPTDDKLKQDAASLCQQYVNYWLPGEVEITVILSRADAPNCAYATTTHNRERLKAQLKQVEETSTIQSMLIKKGRFTR